MLTQRRLLALYGLVVALCLAAATCTDKNPNVPTPTTTTTSTIPTTITTSASTTSTISSGQITDFYGTFNITADRATDTGCNFQSTFTGRVEMSGQSNGSNVTMRMIERLTRIYTGSIAASGAFIVAGTGNLDGFQYNGTMTGTATPTSITGTETMVFTTGCPGRVVAYTFTGTK